MSKAVRINVLVITIVVTLFVFAGLWFMRPGVPNEILEQARQRQTVPLMEVQPPIRKPSVAEVSNTQALAEELLPTLKQELQASLATSIRSELLADQSLVSEVSEAVQPLLLEALQSRLDAFRTEMERSMLSDLKAFRQDLETEATAYGTQIQTTVSDMLATNKAELLNLLPQLVDAQIPRIVEQVVFQLESNKDRYLAIMQQSLPPSLGEADLLAMYDTYRDQIVLDLVPSVLDGMEATIKAEIDAYVEGMPLVKVPAAPSVATPSIQVVSQPQIAPVVQPAPVPVEQQVEPVKTEPAPVQPVLVEPKTESVPAQPVLVQPKTEPVPAQPVLVQPKTEPVSAQPLAPSIPKTVQPKVTVQAPPVPKQGQPTITVPVFEQKETVEFLPPEEYERQRQEIRTKAIEEVLKRIAP